MRALFAVLAIVWTLLLGTIAIQLHQINEHLAWVSGPVKGLAAIGAEAQAKAAAETPQQREAREQREFQDMVSRAARRMEQIAKTKPQGASAK